jgi:hypothetical protein
MSLTPGGPPAILRGTLPLSKPRTAAKHLKLLVYGDPGTGKTFLAGSAEDVPEMQDVFYVDAEKGVLSIQRRGEHLDVFDMNDFDVDAERVVDFLIHESNGQYRTVVLDSLSSIYTMAMRSTENYLMNQSKSGAVDGRALFGETSRSIEVFLKALYDQPISLIATCHEKEVRDERTKEVKVLPSLPGQLATAVARYFDIVGRLYVHVDFEEGGSHRVWDIERRMIMDSHWKYMAKNRFGHGARDGEFIEPTLPKIWQAVYG